jgi:hypothetical protein
VRLRRREPRHPTAIARRRGSRRCHRWGWSRSYYKTFRHNGGRRDQSAVPGLCATYADATEHIITSKLEEFRQSAADCCQMAEAAPSEFAKQHWRAMSSHWVKMAAAEEADEVSSAAGSSKRRCHEVSSDGTLTMTNPLPFRILEPSQSTSPTHFLQRRLALLKVATRSHRFVMGPFTIIDQNQRMFLGLPGFDSCGLIPLTTGDDVPIGLCRSRSQSGRAELAA